MIIQMSDRLKKFLVRKLSLYCCCATGTPKNIGVFSHLKKARSPELLFFFEKQNKWKNTHILKKPQHFFLSRLEPINEMLMPKWAPEKPKTCKPQILVHSNIFTLFSLLTLSIKILWKKMACTNMFYNYMLLHYNNLKRTGVTYHSWSSCMWRKRFRYSLGSSNWEGMGNIDS